MAPGIVPPAQAARMRSVRECKMIRRHDTTRQIDHAEERRTEALDKQAIVTVAAMLAAILAGFVIDPVDASIVAVGAAVAVAMLGAACIEASPRAMVAAAGPQSCPWPSQRLAMEGQTSAYRDQTDVEVQGRAAKSKGRNRLEPEYLPQNWVLTTRAMRQGPIENALHRSLDISASLGLLLVTLPLLLVVAIAIKLDSPGPIFYRQERIGRGNRVFSILKFRSMTIDAEGAGAAQWARVGDSRVTRIGRFLRIYRIDEIPQVLNILRGEMSFVGPRPERPGFVEQLTEAIPHYADRAIVRPGLTGWAQVRYPYGASVEDARNKLSYDLWYIQERSIALDLRIVLATVRVVLGQTGAR